MKRIAALYTCHNRKDKTIKSLASLYSGLESCSHRISMDVYLTDDGSTDGTSEAIRKSYPEVHLLQGDGSLFWAEGMRMSWNRALEKDYDGFLLLNDDVDIYPIVFDQLLTAHEYCTQTFGTPGIYIGPTEDRYKGNLTYSGSLVLNKLLYTQKRLPPNGTFQSCDLANANIMLVSKSVVNQIGILSKGYSHGMADYDYTLMARKKSIPVLVTRDYCGHCENDHVDTYLDFDKKSFEERKKILYSPTGLAFDSYKKYMKKFFPLRYPVVVVMGYLKLYFPGFYLKFMGNRG